MSISTLIMITATSRTSHVLHHLITTHTNRWSSLQPLSNFFIQPIHIQPALPPIPNKRRTSILQHIQIIQINDMPVHRMKLGRLAQTGYQRPGLVVRDRTGKVNASSCRTRDVVFNHGQWLEFTIGGFNRYACGTRATRLGKRVREKRRNVPITRPFPSLPGTCLPTRKQPLTPI
jgi:hypothetical protein